MKRVGLSRFSPSEVSRRVQHCLRSNGVTNRSDVRICNDENSSAEDDMIETEEDERRVNLFAVIKKKFHRTKRGKNVQDENLSIRSRRDKSSIWPIEKNNILRCQNHQTPADQLSDVSSDLIAECGDSDSDEDNGKGLKTFYHNDISNESVTNIFSRSQSPTNFKQNGLSFPSNCLDSNEEFDEEENIYSEPIEYGNDVMLNAPPRRANLTQELYRLSKYGWYWGPVSRSEAELKLENEPDGAFLVRDSSDDRYILSLSFRSYGKTLHTRIEHGNGLFSFYTQTDPEGHASIVDLIEQSMSHSQYGVFCYSRSRYPGSPNFPVRLTKPVSRFTQVRSLQYLCRFVIRDQTRFDHIDSLPLPRVLKNYVEEGPY